MQVNFKLYFATEAKECKKNNSTTLKSVGCQVVKKTNQALLET